MSVTRVIASTAVLESPWQAIAKTAMSPAVSFFNEGRI